MMAAVEHVFGVSATPVLSYVQRKAVDDSFIAALKADKQIVVYGSSKQGKTALVQRYLPYGDHIVVRLSPKTEIEDVYRSVLRQSGIEIHESTANTTGNESTVAVRAGFKASIPFFGGVEAGGDTSDKDNDQTLKTFKEIPFNLSLPQDISELLRATKSGRAIILENFHYLDDTKQAQLAFDLRTFQELGIRFVVLGVWRERNRLAQFNGDLVDRVHEVPVEPWLRSDFENVAHKGEAELRIKFNADILNACMDASFSSIGVFQELLKQTCIAADIKETQTSTVEITDRAFFQLAAQSKAYDYATRHERALESIATGNPGGGRGESIPLFLPYYLVRVICEGGYDGLANGMRRSTIQERIQQIHHRPDDVRASDMSNLLHNLAAMQATKSISPPIVDYDQSSKLLQVVDSTFYFFLKNGDLAQFLATLSNPLDDYKARRTIEVNSGENNAEC
jgi:hypothetical protein